MLCEFRFTKTKKLLSFQCYFLLWKNNNFFQFKCYRNKEEFFLASEPLSYFFVFPQFLENKEYSIYFSIILLYSKKFYANNKKEKNQKEETRIFYIKIENFLCKKNIKGFLTKSWKCLNFSNFEPKV